MRRSSLALIALAALGLGTLVVHAQQRAATPASSKGVNVGSLSCTVAGGTGFVFGSTKALSGTASMFLSAVDRGGRQAANR